MRLYKRVSRFVFRRRFPKGSRSEAKLLWGASLKPGDIISTCAGFNARVKEVIPERWGAANGIGHCARKKEGWITVDFLVKDEAGGVHYTDSCCSKAETKKQIETFWLSASDAYLDEQDRLGWNTVYSRALRAALLRGESICDEDGMILPAFERKNFDHAV